MAQHEKNTDRHKSDRSKTDIPGNQQRNSNDESRQNTGTGHQDKSQERRSDSGRMDRTGEQEQRGNE